ncbi:serine hydrolase domain-containing protein [Amycolatopsis nigrescens]|uniref:serine hydrolase domain-containing protein n=1 Tax=Amycolatopsis nigrescens TaxID=381445 RepID=UPI00039BC513|nr:serine hydrolase domain-containing protein [Amycolatopsis nigrescens]
MTTRPSRRTVLGMAGAAGAAVISGAAPAIAKAAQTSTDSTSGRIPDDLKPGGALDRLVADLAAKDEFSGSLLLTHRGRPVLARSYGMANKAQSVPNGPDTIFGLASVTKLLTAIAVAQLVQRRKIAYGDPLGRHVSGFPAEIADTVTVHHLLTHGSGLGDFHAMPGYWETARTWTTVEQVVAGTTDFVRRSTLAFPPGAGDLYSNSGFHLLGEIVASASGQSFFDYQREHIFRPAGMTGSDFYTTAQWRGDKRIARPYRKEESGERVDTIDEHVFIGTGPGGAFSTCADMDRLVRALLGDKLLEPAFTGLLLDGKLPIGGPRPRAGTAAEPGEQDRPTGFKAYGGIASLTDRNEWNYGLSGGSTGGASTDLGMYPDRGWVSVILSNYQAQTVQPIASLARRLINQ